MKAAALVATLLLAGCATGASVNRAAPPIALDEAGLTPTGSDLRIDFGRAEDGVVDAVSALQGEGPRSRSENRECGAGTMRFAQWDNGLSLNFMEGRFVGWVAQAPFTAAYPAGAVPLGQVPAGQTLEDTSLGREFFAGGLWHLVGEGEGTVSTIWSGTTCFFR